jgi:hypothetical protein
MRPHRRSDEVVPRPEWPLPSEDRHLPGQLDQQLLAFAALTDSDALAVWLPPDG